VFGIDPSTWSVMANVATVLGFGTAALAAIGTLWQVSSARAVQREVSAKQVYAGVLSSGLCYFCSKCLWWRPTWPCAACGENNPSLS